ncbi:hypothetical protein DPMN_158242 [Dreissena polymorpha]|uniref:Uncharacterized protein n=1 Tax=Dreissena polymorpha TaxID=45954 RepID=A0A9D4IPL4_DREPO|nr:hypothetical protein DPMN_158242 [Dreissena polymorpha]
MHQGGLGPLGVKYPFKFRVHHGETKPQSYAHELKDKIRHQHGKLPPCWRLSRAS